MNKERKYAYDKQYVKDRTTTVNVRLNRKTDADLIAYIKLVPNKQGLIKELLRQYILDHPDPTEVRYD